MRRAINPSQRAAQRGVTLIEMIVAIVVTGILLSIVGMFTRNQIASYLDVAARTELADAADTVLRRMARDLHGTLPNSVRVSGNFLEFLPIKAAGRYRAQGNGTAAVDAADNDPLDFTSTTDARFNILGPAVTVAAGDQLVIYNLGSDASYDVYTAPGVANDSSRRALTSTGNNLTSLTYSLVGTNQFLLPSPHNRFQIVGKPVSYACDLATGTLWRYASYAIQATQPATLAALDALAGVTRARLVTDVSECAFSYANAVYQRNGLVSIRLKLTRNGESVTLVHQIDVMNTP